MATTPNYDLPLFDSNAVPSWLRDWNSAMTKIDTAINNVAGTVTTATTNSNNAVATANAAAATANNLSTTVSSLSDRVTALEAGGGGGGGTPPAFNPSQYEIMVQDYVNWTSIGNPLTIPMGSGTAGSHTFTGYDDTAINEGSYAMRIILDAGTGGQGNFGVIDAPDKGGRRNFTIMPYGTGALPITTVEISGTVNLNYNSLNITNPFYIQHQYTANGIANTAGVGWQSPGAAAITAQLQYLYYTGTEKYTLQAKTAS